MIAAVLREPRVLTIQSRPDLAPGPGEAVIRVKAAGLCGTDYRIWNGDRVVTYPRVMGHELIGRVRAIGDEVSGLAVGEKVAVELCPVIALAAVIWRVRHERTTTRRG